MVFTLAKVTRAKEFLETNNLRALFCRQVHPIDGFGEIDGWIFTGAHLDEPQGNILSNCFFRHVVTLSDRSIYSLDIKKGEKRLFPFLSLTLIKNELTLSAARKTTWSFPRRLSPTPRDSCRARHIESHGPLPGRSSSERRLFYS